MIPTLIIGYSLFAKGVWFYYYYALYLVKGKRYDVPFLGETALIIPVYNEDNDKLKQTIESVKNHVPSHVEVVFVNDGSTNKEVIETLNDCNNGRYHILYLKKNVGKRRAQIKGIAYLKRINK